MKPYTLLLLLFNFLVFSQTPISKSLGEFSELKIYDLINVELIESTENKIEITGANTTDVIVIQKNDVLRIRMALHKSFNGSKTFIKLFYTKIHTIDVNEGAKVASESTFKQYELELKAQEGGTISVKTDTKILTIKSVTGGAIETSGTTESQNLNIRTGGIYNGSQLKALNSKIISAIITPASKAMAALIPFVILVSMSTKKTGPIIKAKKKPRGIAA